MADALKNGLGYFFLGLKDCFNGVIRIYQIETEPDSKEEPVREQRNLSVLAQRRAANTPSPRVVQKPEEKPQFIWTLLSCCGWNGGLVLMTLLAFEYLILPTLERLTSLVFLVSGDGEGHGMAWLWIGSVLTFIVNYLWAVPLFVVGKVINTMWFQDIATVAWKTSQHKMKLPNIADFIADLLFSVLLNITFLIQGAIIAMMPFPEPIGWMVDMLNMAMINSCYAFEYRWVNQGYNVNERISRLERQWPYFLGFGLPLAYLTSISDSLIISGSLFSLMFPLLIVSAHCAPEVKGNFDFPLRLWSHSVLRVCDYVFKKSIDRFQRR